MWLYWFKHLKGEPYYDRFYSRYYAFREEDIVRICRPCHKAIHRRYIKVIRKACEESQWSRLSDWTWPEAEALMKKLRKVCATWLK